MCVVFCVCVMRKSYIFMVFSVYLLMPRFPKSRQGKLVGKKPKGLWVAFIWLLLYASLIKAVIYSRQSLTPIVCHERKRYRYPSRKTLLTLVPGHHTCVITSAQQQYTFKQKTLQHSFLKMVRPKSTLQSYLMPASQNL